MYLYLYDSFLVDQKYRRLIDRIETRLTDLGINGRTIRLTILKNAREVIKDNLKAEIDTVVAIGGDKLFAESATALAGTDVSLGFIPVGESKLGQILDIPVSEAACDIISGRRLEQIDLGKINGQYFFNAIDINTSKVNIWCDDSYEIKPQRIKAVKIVNLGWVNFRLSEPDIVIDRLASNARDKFLEIVLDQPDKAKFLFFKKIEEKDSLFFAKKIKISSSNDKEVMVRVDGDRVLKLPVIVEVVPKCLKIIVGRDRMI
ncbi:MAG: diacylglycerol kinase family protein [Patescibacteria group bacterium]|nr:diacylglycerol kinase family protein [Patescibacteria group bacterium]MDD5121680.1 diacylglycerol kinase family protein [Patescibacteria group bacterium]MDD5222081.1 diacylglycerol kinase family protein [Patescibacteria group bacterium]MDD5396156.1 diacylglycerol kinase family protein [Patescibacteria group bacterium]